LKNKPNSFLKYLESDRFYDKIKKTVFSWCTGNKEILMNNIKGYEIDRIADIDDDITLDFLNVWIENKDGGKVNFDISIDLSVDFEGVSGKHHDHDSYTARFWIMVSCSGSLDKRLNDFYIFGVDEFNIAKPKKPLDGDFKPYIQKKDYNEYANEILERYYFTNHPEAKITPTSINMDELPEELTLENSINTLQELAQKGYVAMPEYDLPEDQVYDNEGNPRWICTCTIRSHAIKETAYASSKKVAKKYAAYLCICNIFGFEDKYEDDEN